MIKRLLILVLFLWGAFLSARSQQLPAKTSRDSVLLVRATRDTIPLTDSLKKIVDSVRHYADSVKKADTVLSAAAMLRQIDSLNGSAARSSRC